MNSFKRILLASPRLQEIEFSLLLGWALFFPAKQSYLYFLGFIFMLVFFTLGKIFTLKNIVLSRFSFFLFLLNAPFYLQRLFLPLSVQVAFCSPAMSCWSPCGSSFFTWKKAIWSATCACWPW